MDNLESTLEIDKDYGLQGDIWIREHDFSILDILTSKGDYWYITNYLESIGERFTEEETEEIFEFIRSEIKKFT